MNLKTLDARLIAHLQTYGPALLRDTLAFVFIWFGLLKALGVSPVAQLVAHTLPWFPSNNVVFILGVLEVLIGLLLFFGVALRLTLLVLSLHLLGTFLVFVMLPGQSFRNGNLFLLTMEGEFVLKNIVLFAAALVVGSTLHAMKSHESWRRRAVRRLRRVLP